MQTIRELAADLASGATTARQLVEGCLAAIAAPHGEGERAFLLVAAERARATAEGIDAIRRGGGQLPAWAGVPVAVKDLCDIAGEVTTAGSVVLADRPPAEVNAPVVARLVANGFVVLGRTNMTEFAYSGLGLNAHHDAPRSPWDRAQGHIPGGSSSGSAVAVADGMAAVALGTDTGGSCRIPAAFCGIVGYKPTARRIPLDGIVPLAPSLDSVGPLGRSVDCCAIVDDVFSGGDGLVTASPRPLSGVRLAAITDFVLDGLDPDVARAFEAALARLSAAGVTVTEISFPELHELPTINAGGGLATAEAYHWHRELLARAGERYDQRVRVRIEPGQHQTAADYLDLLAARRRLVGVAARRLEGFDAFVLPTVALVPPTVASFDSGDPAYYSRTNLACLRNTAVGNFLDACAISLPATAPPDPPVGLMLMAGPMADRALFDVARGIEPLLTRA
jgi:aspartyl-tRNA(Asn)/glutamyl-tRNA(Gln) amidotransferase subunit A